MTSNSACGSSAKWQTQEDFFEPRDREQRETKQIFGNGLIPFSEIWACS